MIDPKTQHELNRITDRNKHIVKNAIIKEKPMAEQKEKMKEMSKRLKQGAVKGMSPLEARRAAIKIDNIINNPNSGFDHVVEKVDEKKSSQFDKAMDRDVSRAIKDGRIQPANPNDHFQTKVGQHQQKLRKKGNFKKVEHPYTKKYF